MWFVEVKGRYRGENGWRAGGEGWGGGGMHLLRAATNVSIETTFGAAAVERREERRASDRCGDSASGEADAVGECGDENEDGVPTGSIWNERRREVSGERDESGGQMASAKCTDC